MSTNRKMISNHRNASKSTGPKTREGKGRSSLNAISHGLSASIPIDDRSQKRIDLLTKMFAEGSEDNHAIIELAAEAAEAQVLLERVRDLKRSAWESADRDLAITDCGVLFELNDPVIFSFFYGANNATVRYVKQNLPHMLAKPYASEQER